MKIEEVIYDEDSIKVTIPDPTTLFATDLTKAINRMVIYVDWSPEIVYTDEFMESLDGSQFPDGAKWSTKLKQVIIGATVQALVKKFDEGVVRNE